MIAHDSVFKAHRRQFLQLASVAGAALASGLTLGEARGVRDGDTSVWRHADDLARLLSQPRPFPERLFNISEFGAKPCDLEKRNGWISMHDRGVLDTPAPASPDIYPALRAAINACHDSGGGKVLIPKGNWYCAGPMVLRSNVHVHLESGAHVYFGNRPDDYARDGDHACGENGNLVRARWQGNDCLNFSPLVYAFGQSNIALTGDDWTCVLDGQGGTPFSGDSDECWWTWKGKLRGGTKSDHSEVLPNPRNPQTILAVAPELSAEEVRLIEGNSSRWRTDFGYLPALSEAGVPVEGRVFGLGHFLRPCMIQFIECQDVWLEGYQVTNTPFWQHNPVACRNLTIRKVYANSMGPNNDGFDPESCSNVLIDGCTFNTGDDCIAIKAGKDRDTGYGPTRGVVIQHCVMHSGHGAVTLGSEMAAGIEHVYARNLVFQNANWASSPLNMAIRLKSNMNRGGFLRHFYVKNIDIPNGVSTTPGFYNPLPDMPIAPQTVASTAGAVVVIDCDYAPGEDNARMRPPSVSDVHISGIRVGNVPTPSGRFSCYQAVVILGPVGAEYNGPAPVPKIQPVENVFISDCDFGTPSVMGKPYYVFNGRNIELRHVKFAGKMFTGTLESQS